MRGGEMTYLPLTCGAWLWEDKSTCFGDKNKRLYIIIEDLDERQVRVVGDVAATCPGFLAVPIPVIPKKKKKNWYLSFYFRETFYIIL